MLHLLVSCESWYSHCCGPGVMPRMTFIAFRRRDRHSDPRAFSFECEQLLVLSSVIQPRMTPERMRRVRIAVATPQPIQSFNSSPTLRAPAEPPSSHGSLFRISHCDE